MSNCHHEAHAHDHDHGHGDGHGAHDHSDDITPALQHLLYEQIDFNAIETQNEKITGSGKDVVKKRWADRMEASPELESDLDPELLISIPFTGQVRLHSILIRTSISDSAPSTLRLFLNRDQIGFPSVSDLKPTQELNLSKTNDVQEIPVKRVFFNSTRRLSLFFPDNFGDPTTVISYLAFKGDFLKLNKEPINFLYEAAANPADHKLITGTEKSMDSQIGK